VSQARAPIACRSVEEPRLSNAEIAKRSGGHNISALKWAIAKVGKQEIG